MTRIVPLAQIHNGGWGEAQGVASALIGIRIVQQIPQLLQWNHQKHLIIKKKFNLEALKNTWREEDHFLDHFVGDSICKFLRRWRSPSFWLRVAWKHPETNNGT